MKQQQTPTPQGEILPGEQCGAFYLQEFTNPFPLPKEKDSSAEKGEILEGFTGGYK